MRQKLISSCVLLLLLANLYVWQRVAVAADNDPAIYFLNVGQGDATLITSGDHQVLIDGGPDNSVLAGLGEAMPTWDRTIDLVVLTHPQSDHLIGLFSVLERYRVDEILATFGEYDSSLNREWIKAAKQSGAQLNYADSADDFTFGNLYLDTLLPLTPSVQLLDINEDSVIVRASGKRSSALLMGDAGFATENNLLNIYPGLIADVLKVGHHGSKYSSSPNFIKQINIKSAVISVGKNSYGHPAPDTLNNLDKIGVSVHRTDKDGTVKFAL